MPNIKSVVRDELPDGKVDDISFEGANIILYTKDRDFCFGNDDLIKSIVNKIKKRIELRPHPSLTVDQDKAREAIKDIVPDAAGLDQITFDSERSIVILEAENTNEITRRSSDAKEKIQRETYWVPEVKRTPKIRSPIIENIRGVLYQNSKERKDFLHETGERVYNGWERNQKQDEWVRLSFLGGSRQVGRSCLLLQTPESNIILDCGIDVAGQGEDAYPYLQAPEFNIRGIDAVIVTHCHVDHTGLVPYLYKFGYDGPVYTTAPTRDIMALLQLDTIKIHQNEGRKELYSQEHVKQMVEHTIPLEYRQVTDLTPDVRLTLYNAGHTIGSAMAHLNIGNGLHNLLYTGDIKYKDTRLLSKAHTRFRRVETMVLESTYGGEDCVSDDEDQDEKLSAIVKDTINRDGKVLMPVLGSGRGQEIIMMIVNLMQDGEIPTVPIYVDGMVWDITAIHTAYPEFLNRNVRHEIFNENNNPFTHDSITKVGSHEERQKIIEEAEPCIVLATSGMLVGGPSVEYLKGFAEDQRSSLIFSCYQADGSLGRRIQGGQRRLTFHDSGTEEHVQLKMNVSEITVSGHADRDELMHFVKRLKPQPDRIMINHGDEERSIDLRTSLHKRYHMRTEVPNNLDCLRLE